MRNLIVPIAFAAALVAAAPAFAQRPSLAERVAALEMRAADNSATVDLLNQVNQLREEVLALRAQLEELQQQVEQLRSTSRSQYLDLDGRLNRLEGGAVPAVEAAPPAGAAAVPAAAAGGKPAPVIRDLPPSVHGDPGPLSKMADERTAYEAAFAALKAGEYVESARLFERFLADYPNGTYAPNARYWLGESYYVTGNYAMALEQFRQVIEQYPTHDKTPGALLKVGLSLYGLNDLDGAEAALAQVSRQYPGTDAARTAEDRLHAIQLSRLR